MAMAKPISTTYQAPWLMTQKGSRGVPAAALSITMRVRLRIIHVSRTMMMSETYKAAKMLPSYMRMRTYLDCFVSPHLLSRRSSM